MKVSIITVSYNSEKTLKDTMDSVFHQSYQNIEHIIIDGASNDDTINIIKQYERNYEKSPKRFDWLSEKDKGIYDAINKGIKMATGEIIGILNSDDYFYDNKVIEDIVNKFKSKEIDCLYGNMIYINSETKRTVRTWKSKDFEPGLFEKSWTPGHPTFYCKTQVYRDYGLYKDNYKIAADVELMYRVLDKKKIKSLFYDRYIVVMRQGGVSSSGLKSTIIITKEMKRAIKENGGNFNPLKYLIFKGLKIKEFIKSK